VTNTPNRPGAPRRTGPQPLLTLEQCRQIAREFDGSSKTIDELLVRWRKVVPELKRHNLIAAARRGGYVTKKERKPWTTAEERFLRDNWQRLSDHEIARLLGRSYTSVIVRRKRIGIGRRDRSKSAIRDQDEPTEADRLWDDQIVLRDRVSAQVNPFLSLLAWRCDSLNQAA